MTTNFPKPSSILISTIFQKVLVSIAGLVLIAFVIFHLWGNLLLIWGTDQSFNFYVHRLHQWPWFRGALEILLMVALGVHIYYGITIALQNRQANPQSYLATPWWQKIIDRSSLITGLLLFFFICVHLQNFRLADISTHSITISDQILENWQEIITETFQQPLYLIFYVVITIPLGCHLYNGLYRSIQSLGITINSTRIWKTVSWVAASTISIGFALIPLVVWSRIGAT